MVHKALASPSDHQVTKRRLMTKLGLKPFRVYDDEVRTARRMGTATLDKDSGWDEHRATGRTTRMIIDLMLKLLEQDQGVTLVCHKQYAAEGIARQIILQFSCGTHWRSNGVLEKVQL